MLYQEAIPVVLERDFLLASALFLAAAFLAANAFFLAASILANLAFSALALASASALRAAFLALEVNGIWTGSPTPSDMVSHDGIMRQINKTIL